LYKLSTTLSLVLSMRHAPCLYFMFIFSALYGMPARTSDDKAVRPSVCLSVKRVHCDKTEEKMSRYLHHTKGHLA